MVGLLASGLAGMLLFFWLPVQYSGEVRLRVVAPRSAQADLIHPSTTLETVLRRPEVAELVTVRQQRDPLAWLGDHLTVEFSPIPDILLFRVTSALPYEAAVLVQAVVEVYHHEATVRHETSLRQQKEARGPMQEGLRQKRERLTQLENTRRDVAERECQQARFDLRVARAELAAEEQRRSGAYTGPSPIKSWKLI
jgi:hypothetical protein